MGFMEDIVASARASQPATTSTARNRGSGRTTLGPLHSGFYYSGGAGVGYKPPATISGKGKTGSGPSALAAAVGQTYTPPTQQGKEIDPPASKQSRQDARAMFANLLKNEYGFTDEEVNMLMPEIEKWVNDYGWDVPTVIANIPSTEAYQRRFPAINARKKNGYNPITAQEYLAYEDQVKQDLARNGIDVNVYGTRDRIDYWIANNVSADEISNRAAMANNAAMSWAGDTAEGRFAEKAFGPNVRNDAAGFYFDRSRGEQELANITKQIEIGGEAYRANLDIGLSYAAELQEIGIDRDTARTVFQNAALSKDNLVKLTEIEGGKITQREITDAGFGVDAESVEKLRGLSSRERAKFSGQANSTAAFGRSAGGQF